MNEYTNNRIRSQGNIIYPELSFKIMGTIFQVNNELGFGLKEVSYQKAIQIALEKAGIKHKRELPIKITYDEKFVATIFIDFLIEGVIALELKRGDKFMKQDIDQTYKYLKQGNLKPGILARFTKHGVKYKRIVNMQ